MSDHLAAWLRLYHVQGVGPTTYRKLLDRFKSPQNALATTSSAFSGLGIPARTIERIQTAQDTLVGRDLEWEQQPNHHILTLADPRYPYRLSEIPAAPPILYVIGNPEYLAYPQIAVVGSRNPTAGGIENTRAFATFLANSGLTITSGLALGIDGTSHEATLKAGGITIAVAATGLDRVYPAKHRDLARRIANQGAIVSEFAVGTPPKAEYFPRRNRIISGLSLGTLVVEANLRSGSLITARHTLEQGREVYAIPGSIHNPLSKGCHQLIREGAKLVETAEHIFEELAGQIQLNDSLNTVVVESEDHHSFDLDADYQKLLDAMGFDPVTCDVVVERSGLTPEAVSSMLLILELNGHVATATNGTYQRIKPDAES